MKMQTNHRPFPLPIRPWMMTQTWNDVFFIHWPIDFDDIRDKVPKQLYIDTFDGRAWIGIIPFHITDFKVRDVFSIPLTNAFPEINVRTYVTYDNKPGVYFFSLDAGHWMASVAARTLTPLPYYFSKIDLTKQNGAITYKSSRQDKNSSNGEFEGTFSSISSTYKSEKGTLDEWLTERYCFYTMNRNKLYRCDIHHEKWELQKAEGEILTDTLVSSQRISLPDKKPVLHYASRNKALIWPLVRVRK
ncbi:YqjF family protein [Scopulibacillus cellulosilyticus]|uniref:YqjF family protein n=1 Tax=Scopulibacillus cellulosilyticus TaxID=2665665 RepID=A0ABW2PQU1_9BACL